MPIHHQKREDIDIVLKVLESLVEANAGGPFVQSLYYQYQERGSLSKKQLEGLLGKSIQSKLIPDRWLATLEAIIKKMPTREKAAPSAAAPLFVKNEATGIMLNEVLQKFPLHRQALLLKNKYDLNEIITEREMKELKQFHLLASKK